MRRSLEELAIELACERMEAEDLRRLEQCQEEFLQGDPQRKSYGDGRE